MNDLRIFMVTAAALMAGCSEYRSEKATEAEKAIMTQAYVECLEAAALKVRTAQDRLDDLEAVDHRNASKMLASCEDDYKKLVALAARGEPADYKTAFDRVMRAKFTDVAAVIARRTPLMADDDPFAKRLKGIDLAPPR